MGRSKVCPIRRDPLTSALLDQAAVGLAGKQRRRGGSYDRGVKHGADDEERTGSYDQHGRRSFMVLLQGRDSSEGERPNHEVDGLDADEGHEDAAHAVDEQVAAQERGGAQGPVRDTPERQRE